MTARILLLVFFCCVMKMAKAQTPPDFTFTDIDGTVHNLHHALDQGYIVLLEFFFADCGPCISVAPELQAIHEDHEDQNVLVWAISDIDDNARINQFREEFGQTYTFGGVEGNGYEILELYAENYVFLGYPTVSVICPNGEMTWDIFPYSNGAPEWRESIEACGLEKLDPYQPIGEVTKTSGSFLNDDFDVKVSPNPIQNTSIIHFTLEQNAEVTFELYDALGKNIPINKDMVLKAGTHRISLPFENISPGSYLLKIHLAGIGIKTLKLIKI